MVARVMAAIRGTGYPVTIWYAPADAGPEMIRWLGQDADLRLQASGDLGARLNAAARSIPEGDRWIVVAGDCPGLGTGDLAHAAELLDEWPVVLGPAPDGGFYLLAGRSPLPDLFAEIPWGSGRVLDEVRRRLQSLGVKWTELPLLRTVHTSADARAAGLLT
jgi:glycosyltransferase A (GT-A) superfamily protein (DUF2064 family)